MSFGSFDSSTPNTKGANAEINMVPLIDVMLVLLVIFLITAPLITHSINVQLPRVDAQGIDTEQQPVDVAITAEGVIYIDDQPVEIDTLPNFLSSLENVTSHSQVRIRADEAVNYGLVAKTMGVLKDAGLNKIGFITQAEN